MRNHSNDDLMKNDYGVKTNNTDFVTYSGGPKKGSKKDANDLYCDNCNKYYNKNKWKPITETYTEDHNNLCAPYSLADSLSVRDDAKMSIVFYSVYLQCPKCGKKYLIKKYSKFVHK